MQDGTQLPPPPPPNGPDPTSGQPDDDPTRPDRSSSPFAGGSPPPPPPMPPIPPMPPMGAPEPLPPSVPGGYTTPPPVPPPGPPPRVSNELFDRSNLLGLLSALFGIIALPCCCIRFGGILPAVAAIVLGVLHLQKTRRGEATMRWLGILGLVLGGLGLALSICLGVVSWGTDFRNDVTP